MRKFLARPADQQVNALDDQGGIHMEPHDDDALLTPSEVAAMFRVNPKTVTRWARAGKISAIRTLGGHRRFRASEIRQFLEQVEESDRI
jgi:excisionase family DNA binding protein